MNDENDNNNDPLGILIVLGVVFWAGFCIAWWLV